MAIAAIRRETSVPMIEGYQVLRQGLGVLPRLAAEMRNIRPINRISLSADARYIATASDLDGSVRAWDTRSGRVAAQKSYSRSVPFLSLAISPRAEYLAVVYGGVIEILDLREALRGHSGTKLTSVAFHPAIRTPGATAFSPDGQFFAEAGYGGAVVRIWSVEGWKQLSEVVPGGVSSVGFSPDGKHVFTVGKDGTPVTLTTVKAPDSQRRTAAHAAGVAAFSPDGTHLATADGDTAVRVWRLVASGPEWREITRFAHQGRATSLAISSSGARVAVGEEDGSARVWDTGETREVLWHTHGGVVTGVAFSRDGAYVATAGEDGNTRLWSTREDEATIALAERTDFRAVALSGDGRRIRTVGSDGRVRSWDASSGTEVPIAKSVAATMSDGEIPYIFQAGALSLDGLHAAIAVSDGTILIGNTESGETTELSVREEVVAVAVRSSRGLAAAASPRAIDVWRTAEPRKPAYRFQGGDFRTLALSHDGCLLAAGNGRGIRLWDMSSGRETRRLQTDETMNVVCFSNDGMRLAAAGVGGRFYVWELSSVAPPLRVTAGPRNVQAVALSPDGRFFALASDGITGVWEVTGDQEVARLVHDATVAALAFSPDGARLATASRDRTARVSLWKPEDLIQQACNRLPQRLKSKVTCRGAGVAHQR